MKRTAPLPRRGARAASAFTLLLALGLLPSLSEAQPRPDPPAAPAQPAPGAAPAAPPAAVAQPAAPAAPPAQPTPPERTDPIAKALAPQPGGLTPEQVGQAAIKVRPSIRVKQAQLQEAAARVDQALVNYFPRLTVTATYTRYSPVELGLGGGGAIVGTLNGGFLGTGPCPPPAPAGTTCVLDSGGSPAFASALPAPALNSLSFVASLAVPISDYVLRVSQGYAAASRSENARKLEVQAETLTVAADSKVSFFNWVRAKGNLVVARESVEQAKAHLADARRTFEVGLISRADVLRLEAQVASAEQLAVEAEAFVAVAEEQLRIAIGAPADQSIEIGVDIMGASPAPPAGSLQALQQEALRKRLEIRALDETIYSLKEAESVTRAGYYPRLDGVANLIYANPNPRIAFGPNEFNATWDVGVRLTWTVNETFTASGATAEARARTAAVQEQKAVLRDGLRLEVTSAYTDAIKASGSLDAAQRQLTAAEESMRVRTELFRAGRATSVDLVDAEAEVTRARLRLIEARIGLLVAKTRLDHAVGRDVK
jgi:outer membrane protein TolC